MMAHHEKCTCDECMTKTEITLSLSSRGGLVFLRQGKVLHSEHYSEPIRVPSVVLQTWSQEDLFPNQEPKLDT